jgi:DNA-binding response OmpR family regulator
MHKDKNFATVLLLESARSNGASFAPHLQGRYEVLLAHNGKQAISIIKGTRPDVMVLDAASMRTSGDRICASLRNSTEDVPIIHIKQEGDTATHSASVADELMYLPFTYRKLCNRIERFVRVTQGEVLTIGPFRLNIHQQILTSPVGDQKLTPKLARLLEVLMRHPDEVVERKQLIKQVWQTDYMGDTRTLDVHIRWLRQAIEKKPSKPKFLKTVRGKGYILSIPEK